LRNSDSATNLAWLLNNAGQAGAKPMDANRTAAKGGSASSAFLPLTLDVEGR
jgi:hypothetical protein